MADEPQELPSGSWTIGHWLLPLLAVAALVVIVVARYPQRGDSPGQAANADRQGASAGVIQLEIDYGDGVEKRLTALPWHAGMTVAGAMELAAEHRRGIRYTQEGSGKDALLVSIDDEKNEGGGPSSRNWIYSVNGVRGDRSFAIDELQPGDTVLWSFEAYE